MAKKWHHYLTKPSNAVIGSISVGSLASSYAMNTSEVFLLTVGATPAFVLANGSAFAGIALPIASAALSIYRRRQAQVHKDILTELQSSSMLDFAKEYLRPVGGSLYEISKPDIEFAIQYVDTSRRASLSAILNYRAFRGQQWADTIDNKKKRNLSFLQENFMCQAMIKNPSDIRWDMLPSSFPDMDFAGTSWRRPYIGLSVILPLLSSARASYFNKDGFADNDFPSNYICRYNRSDATIRKTNEFILFTSALDVVFLDQLKSVHERFKYFRLMVLATLYHLYKMIEIHQDKDVVDVWIQNDSSKIEKILLSLGFKRAIGMRTADCEKVFHMQLRRAPGR